MSNNIQNNRNRTSIFLGPNTLFVLAALAYSIQHHNFMVLFWTCVILGNLAMIFTAIADITNK